MGKVVQGDFTRKKNVELQTQSKNEPVPGYQLKMAVAFSDPLIWRIVLVPGNLTLSGLHETIQTCMGWSNREAHQFLVGKIFYQPGFGIEQMDRKPEYDEAKFELHQLEEGMQFLFTYLYDAGAGWELELAVEEIIEEGAEQSFPILISGKRACPPEEIGDIHTYQSFLDVFEKSDKGAGKSQIIPEFPDFDPELCDYEAINMILAQIGNNNS